MSDYPQTAVSHIARTRHLYFAQRDTTPACFGPFVTILQIFIYSRIYLSTNSTASTYISGVIFFSFAFPVTRLITT